MSSLELRAQRLWPNHPAYQAQWLRMINLLGSNWLLYHDPNHPRT
jgi:hypothetical protein